MNPDLRSRRAPTGAAALLLLLAPLAGAAPAAAQEALMLGKVALGHGPASEPLRVRVDRESFTTPAVLLRVGGVAFMETATPAGTARGQPVRLAYDPARPDGSRLAVTVGGTTHRVELPDWQLVPIALYAASEHNAAVSLFGERSTDDEYEAVYHPALANTLLGVRLLQADLLLMLDKGDAVQLPRQGGGTVLGAGEAVPDVSEAFRARRMIAQAMQGYTFHSWVLTDRGHPILFGVEADRFYITGEPYYYFWDRTPRLVAIQDSVGLVIGRYNQGVDAYNAQLARLRGRGTTAADQKQLRGMEARLRADSQTVARLQREEERAGTMPVAGATAALRKLHDAVYAFNPAVHDAAVRTMRWAAFFRYVRETDPAHWREFEARLRNVPVQPPLRTPNRVPHVRND